MQRVSSAPNIVSGLKRAQEKGSHTLMVSLAQGIGHAPVAVVAGALVVVGVAVVAASTHKQ